MSLPNSVKFKKDGIEFTDNTERTQHTMHELCRAALRDSGKHICRSTRKKIKRQTGRLAKNTQYWVRKKQKYPDLQVGFKPGGFYGIFQEIGTSEQPKIGALSSSVEDDIETIRKIQAQYLSAIAEDNINGLIDEEEMIGE